MSNTTPDDARTDPDRYPLESSPSTDTFATAEVMGAEDAHTVSEYEDPEESDPPTCETMLRETPSTLEVAL